MRSVLSSVESRTCLLHVIAKRISSRSVTLVALKLSTTGRSIWTARLPDRFGLTDATSNADIAGGDCAATAVAHHTKAIHRISANTEYSAGTPVVQATAAKQCLSAPVGQFREKRR